MKISLMNIVTSGNGKVELGTCEQCFSVARANLPEAEFLVDGEFYFVELYDKDDYNYSELSVEEYDGEKPDEFGNMIDFAYWLSENEFRELNESESMVKFLYDLTEDYFDYKDGIIPFGNIKEGYLK